MSAHGIWAVAIVGVLIAAEMAVEEWRDRRARRQARNRGAAAHAAATPAAPPAWWHLTRR
jgi:hypothetical protein